MNKLALLILTLALPTASWATLTLAQFDSKMQQQIAQLAHTTSATVYMEVLNSGQQIFAYNPDTALVPASASKVMTTSFALEKLGPGFTYQTQVLLQGNDLLVVGSGDPYLVTERLEALAQTVAARIKHVGTIRLDNSAYTQDYKGLAQFAGFDGETDASIVSPTSLNFNLLSVTVSPARNGAVISVGPAHNGYAIIRNNVHLVAGRASGVWMRSLGMQGAQEVFEVDGNLGRSAAAQGLQLAVTSPEGHFAYAFAGLLRDHGVTVDVDYGGTTTSPTPAVGQLLAASDSLPFNQLADLYMTYSNNFMAEQTFQTLGSAALGGPADISKSQQAIAAFLHQRPACQDATMENGSGLTWNNKISGRCFVQTMQSLASNLSLYTDLIASFPAGEHQGTLASRFAGAPAGFKPALVHAKTGTLWSKVATSALVGVTTAGSGQAVLFALVENDTRNVESVTGSLKAWEDQAVELIQQLQIQTLSSQFQDGFSPFL
jgi:D-alanyl-D-alanine carboxypeptidase/D-alanyl-D-alanine-endopeptidase (penicillin-binding protein 4)